MSYDAVVLLGILEGIQGLPYRLGQFLRDDRFHKECPSCDKHVSKLQGGLFCPYCGKQAFSESEIDQNLRSCFKCEKFYNFYYSYCPECGKEMKSLSDSDHVAVMGVIYEQMLDRSSLEDGLLFDEIPDKGIVERIRGLKKV